jgi:hypothetical protein
MRAAFEDHLQADPYGTLVDPIVVEAQSGAQQRGLSYEELWRQRPHFEEPAPRAERPHGFQGFAGLAVTLVAVMAVVGLREKIVSFAPPAAAVFKAVGLPVNVQGLDLRRVTSRILMDGPRKILAIEGEIANLRRLPTQVPQLALTVRGDDGQTKYSWTSPAPRNQLQPGETAPFRARLAAPPDNGTQVLVRFASLEETVGAKSPHAGR